MRVLEPPARLAPPRWVIDPEFDLLWHVRRIDAPTPRTPAVVMDVARQAATTAFDPAHPLWEFTVVEHVDGDRAALVMKVHHALTDGVGGMELALQLFDLEPVAPPQGARPDAPVGEPPSTIDLVRDGLCHNGRRLAELARHEAAAAPAAAARAVRHPQRTIREAAATAASIGRTVAPVTDTLSTLMVERGTARALSMVTVELADLKRAAGAAGGSVNDGFMAGVAAGMRRYHVEHGVPVGDLRVTLPINIRTASDPAIGNRITLQRFAVPVQLQDPAAAIREMGVRCRAARDEPSAEHVNAIAGVLNLLPSNVVGGMLKHVDFLASNVPGFTFPVHLAGARVVGYFPFGPTIGAALNVTLLSYDGTCCIGLTVDTAAVPDPTVLTRAMAAGFEEVLGLGGEHTPVVVPIDDGVYPGTAAAPVVAGP